ncbi:MAG: putative Histidine kinase [Candidatus Saccharibacteria bacterium]|nr:putative Histidine kinase [Candidatus Saccharibacteria bacterium]
MRSRLASSLFRSATIRLTVYYLLIVMTISISFSFALYHVATGEVRRGLHMESTRITSLFPVFENAPGIYSPDAEADQAASRIFWRLFSSNVVVLVGAGFLSYVLARRTLQPIEEAHSQQARFTSDVSHELRTPLTAVRMESEVALLDSTATKTELRHTLHSTIEEVGKMETLINNLLRLTKLDSAHLQASFVRLDTQALVAEAIDRVAKNAEARQIALTSVADQYFIRGDEANVIQLLVILLENGIKYSPPHSGIEVTTARKGDSIEITISDHGMGIERSALDHIFDRFYRADSSRTRGDTEGFGLGLSIAKAIADSHKARITIASRVGQGTQATVHFAAAPARPSEEPQATH